MGEAFKRLLQAARFERDAFVWMYFNDRASGDALIFVLLTSLGLLLASGFTVFGLVTSSRGINFFFGSLPGLASAGSAGSCSGRHGSSPSSLKEFVMNPTFR